MTTVLRRGATACPFRYHPMLRALTVRPPAIFPLDCRRGSRFIVARPLANQTERLIGGHDDGIGKHDDGIVPGGSESPL
jgi:hypothetical protein